jgi:hypothetical protein
MGEKKTLAVCEHLRSPPGTSSAILLIIGRHEILQGNSVKRMANATFIPSPFEETELRSKIADILESK